jgi:hypothetical protein
MEFVLDDTQDELVRAVRGIVDRHEQTMVTQATAVYDTTLESALESAGCLDLATSGGSLLDAALVTEQVARSSAVIPVGYRTLVAPLLGDAVAWPFTITDRPGGGVTRFAESARDIVVVDGDAVTVFSADDCTVEPAGSAWSFPVGRVTPRGGGRRLDLPGSAVLERWWVALAAELVGTTAAAFDLTVDFVKERRQFGRPIGSYQALQHRLAELAVELEGARLLAYHAAWSAPDRAAAAAAATWAMRTAKHAFYECHQMHGAIGFTNEYPLHRWSLRLRALAVEAGGFEAASRAMTVSAFG